MILDRWRSLAEQRLMRIEELEMQIASTIRLELDELPDNTNTNTSEWIAVLADEVEKGWYVASPSGRIKLAWYDPDDDQTHRHLDETRLCLKPRGEK